VISLLAAATDEMGGRAWLTTKAKLSKAGRSERVAFTGANDNERERMLGEAIALSDLLSGKSVVDPEMLGLAASVKERLQDAARKGETAAPPAEVPPEALGRNGEFVAYNPTEDAKPGSPYRWGMTIDLDRCTGCSACVAACYLENNIPIVGEEQSIRGRIMSWLRIERYVTEGDVDFIPGRPPHSTLERLGHVGVRHLPMMCQHCGSAPCEPVCPVFATYHNPEGLNGMVYNRCIGTRYCSNNCPYKVRRFNYYNYGLDNWPEPMKLMLNPDVTVRCKGVMEKCTYCTQRVEAARQPAKNEKRLIRDGEVTTACAQSCPTQAITFGNLKDADSQVAKKGSDPKRGYHALHVLNTRPATTYLAKVVRGSVEV